MVFDLLFEKAFHFEEPGFIGVVSRSPRLLFPGKNQNAGIPVFYIAGILGLTMAVKIKLARFGKIRLPPVPHLRRRRHASPRRPLHRGHRPYHPKEDPSLIEIDSERAQYWLGVGAQPTDPVLALLKITGDWQKFKGLPGAEGTLKVAEPKTSKLDLFNAALAEADGAPSGEADQAEEEEGSGQEGRS